MLLKRFPQPQPLTNTIVILKASIMTAACEGKRTKMRRTKPNNNPATMLLVLMMLPLLLLLCRHRHSSSPVAVFVLGDAGVDGSVDGVVDREGGGGGGGGRPCLTEADLDFEDCDLDDLDDGALAVSRLPSSSPRIRCISALSRPLNSVVAFPLSSMSGPFAHWTYHHARRKYAAGSDSTCLRTSSRSWMRTGTIRRWPGGNRRVPPGRTRTRIT